MALERAVHDEVGARERSRRPKERRLDDVDERFLVLVVGVPGVVEHTRLVGDVEAPASRRARRTTPTRDRDPDATAACRRRAPARSSPVEHRRPRARGAARRASRGREASRARRGSACPGLRLPRSRSSGSTHPCSRAARAATRRGGAPRAARSSGTARRRRGPCSRSARAGPRAPNSSAGSASSYEYDGGAPSRRRPPAITERHGLAGDLHVGHPEPAVPPHDPRVPEVVVLDPQRLVPESRIDVIEPARPRLVQVLIGIDDRCHGPPSATLAPASPRPGGGRGATEGPPTLVVRCPRSCRTSTRSRPSRSTSSARSRPSSRSRCSSSPAARTRP